MTDSLEPKKNALTYEDLDGCIAASIWDWDIQKGTVLRKLGSESFYGYSDKDAESFLGWWAEHTHPDDRERIIKDLNEAIESDRDTWVGEYRFLKTDGNYSRVVDRGFIIRDHRGKAIRILGAMVDATRLFQAEDDRQMLLNLSKMDLQKLGDQRDAREKFVSTLSHDLRTPLTAAKMSAQLIMRNDIDAARQQRLLIKIVDCIDRADSMIKDLLDANKIQAAKKLTLTISACNLNEISKAVLEEFATVYGDRFVLRVTKIIEGFWDQEYIRRAIENLCSNAIKYGAPRDPITLSLENLDDEVSLSVHNFGNPINLEDQESLFNPFQRTITAESSDQNGWGLGLTLVRGTAEAHGGEVSIQSNAESGTTFKMTFPRDCRN